MSTLMKALIGSNNYNLAVKESDRDYKEVVMPGTKEIFTGEKISYVKKVDGNDVAVHDVRDLPRLFTKSNINFIEMLFSQDYEITDDGFRTSFKDLMEIKEEIASMNLSYLYDACRGMVFNKAKKLYREDSTMNHKVATTCIRLQDFLKRYSDNEFTSFEDAFRYKDDEERRYELLMLRNGKDEIYHRLSALTMEDTLRREHIYRYHSLNIGTYDKVYEICRNMFFERIDKGAD